MSPREFYENYVKPSCDEFVAAPNDERKAQNAAHWANVMAERMWHHCKDNIPHRVYSVPNLSTYRKALIDSCADFGLVWDIDDGAKHVTLDRPTRRISTASQTGVGSMAYGEGVYDEGVYGGGPQAVVTLDDGTKRALVGIVANVGAMWDRITQGL